MSQSNSAKKKIQIVIVGGDCCSLILPQHAPASSFTESGVF